MKQDAEAALFAVKCFAGAMLAYYIALSIGLSHPFWAVTTSYIVSQPLAGAVLSKALFRLTGTLVGAAVAVLLVPNFVNEPAVLSAVLALWLGLCLYISLLDRTPRAYVFLLAGYTASLIGFPAVETPGAIFDIASARAQEISLGILSASFVHGVFLPRSVTQRLLARVETVLADAEGWSIAALAGEKGEALDRERRRLAVDLNELHQLSTHLPFDVARFTPRTRTLRALQDQLALLLPVASTVEDRLAVLAAQGGVPAPVAALIARVEEWLADGVARPDRAESAAALIAEAAALEPQPGPGEADWRDMLLMNLLSRLGDLIAAHRDARSLRDQLRVPSPRPITPQVAALLAAANARSMHLDHFLALRAALGTMAAVGIGCAFWIVTGWKDGATGVALASVCCALFGNIDRPGPLVFQFFVGSLIGAAVAMVYAFVILPRVTDFVTLAAVLAPAMLLVGSAMARPRYTLMALGVILTFPSAVGLNAAYTGDFIAFANGVLSQLLGTGFAVVSVGLFQTVGVEHSIARLSRAGWADVARRAAGRAPDAGLWMGRMLDRVGLLLPRMAAFGPGAKPLVDALADLRVGFVAGELGRMQPSATAEERAQIAATLSGIQRHYAALRPARMVPPGDGLLVDIDRTVAAFAADPVAERRRQGLVLLTSLRRNLFPNAPAYEELAA